MSGLVALHRACIVAAATYFLSGFAFAQMPGVPGIGAAAPGKESTKPAAGGSASDAALVAELRSRLAEETRRLEILDANEATGAPPGTDQRSLQTHHARVAVMVRTLTQHLIDIEKLAGAREQRLIVDSELKAWAGLTEKPPYSILLADRLRAEHLAAQANLEALQARQALLQQMTATFRDRYKEAELQLRQITEKAELGRTENTQAKFDWERNAASLLVQLGKALIGHNETKRLLIDEELAVAQSQIELVRRKLEQAESETQFSAEDMAHVRAALGSDRDRLLAEVDRLALDQTRFQTITMAARKASELLRASGGRAGETEAQYSARLYLLEKDYELKRARMDITSTRVELLRGELDIIRGKGLLWEARYTAYTKKDAASRQAAREGAEKLMTFLVIQKNNFEQLQKKARSDVMEIETRLENVEVSAENSHLRQLQNIQSEQVTTLQRTMAAVDGGITLANQMLVEFGGKNTQSLARRSEVWQATALRYATSFWNFELIAVEDSIEVDGKEIAGKRSVTIGKIINALLLIVVGYALAVALARLAEKLLVRYLGWKPAHAHILRSWLLAIELAILILTVLLWVKIPLTVFAFLGGAVAIGLGFGMQTLMKNLISGVMVLGEQPFRIGDLVEVGDIRGIITNIGLRASTLTDFNGIETIIPNSTFIEQNLTNWTHTSGRVRFNVKVGVAYGSPVRIVSQLLLEVAERHGKVLKDPPPEVSFEDFASDALNFVLYFWIDISTGSSGRQVSSDLRAMIEGAFTDRGIVIAYPQRHVHLDVSSPLQVRIVPDEPPAAPEKVALVKTNPVLP